MKHILFAAIVLMVSSTTLLGAEDSAIDTSYFQNHFSIGINDLPWEASSASLKWWKNGKTGFQLNVGSITTGYSKTESTYDNESILNGGISNIGVYWLRRDALKRINGFFIEKGLGVSTSIFGNLRYRTVRSASDTLSDSLADSRIYVDVRLPLGFEHFPIRGTNNISYSLDLDFYLGSGYLYRRNVDERNTGSRMNNFNFSIGVTPRFYLRWYIY
jgi:hypothetical protein